MAKNSASSFVPFDMGRLWKITYLVAVCTPLYSTLPGLPIHEASTQILSTIGLLTGIIFPLSLA
jgi:hypothetical protein